MKFGVLFFDVDSTLVTMEGIDHLSGDNPEVAELTRRAMNGELPLDEVYAARLELVRPSLRAIEELGETYISRLLPDAKETVEALRSRGIDVHLLTAGIEQAVLPLAAHLGIAPRAVHAVRLTFNEDGSYADFDRRSPLARAGGKETVVINTRLRIKGRAVMVGDGVSDLEAKPAVDLFIGFGGVVARETVRAGADVYIDVPSLWRVVEILEERS